MQQEEERGRLFGSIVKGVLAGIAIFTLFGKTDNIKKYFEHTFETPIIEGATYEEEVDEEDIQTPESTTTYEPSNSDEEVFTVVETMPKYRGCENLTGDVATQCTMQKIQRYTAQVDYPQIAIDNDIEGKVYIRFVIDASGNVSEVKLLRGVDKLLDNAALNHIKKMPKFASPGTQRGKAVKVQYNIPIVFKLG